MIVYYRGGALTFSFTVAVAYCGARAGLPIDQAKHTTDGAHMASLLGSSNQWRVSCFEKGKVSPNFQHFFFRCRNDVIDLSLSWRWGQTGYGSVSNVPLATKRTAFCRSLRISTNFTETAAARSSVSLGSEIESLIIFKCTKLGNRCVSFITAQLGNRISSIGWMIHNRVAN